MDDISYDLDLMPDATEDGSRQVLISVLRKLPQDVRERTLENVTFIMMPKGHHGSAIQRYCAPHVQPKAKWFIFLNMGDIPEADREKTVAHEIAHFILEDGTEQETDDLCEQWGFGRAYKDYKLFR